MSVEDLIQQLAQYPGHYTVKALLVCGPEIDDKAADFSGVQQNPINKIVWIELETPLRP